MDDLETALNVYGNEVTSACCSFYVWKHINNIAADKAEVRQAPLAQLKRNLRQDRVAISHG